MEQSRPPRPWFSVFDTASEYGNGRRTKMFSRTSPASLLYSDWSNLFFPTRGWLTAGHVVAETAGPSFVQNGLNASHTPSSRRVRFSMPISFCRRLSRGPLRAAVVLSALAGCNDNGPAAPPPEIPSAGTIATVTAAPTGGLSALLLVISGRVDSLRVTQPNTGGVVYPVPGDAQRFLVTGALTSGSTLRLFVPGQTATGYTIKVEQASDANFAVADTSTVRVRLSP